MSGDGTAPAASNSAPLCTSSVASPPSSRIMFGPLAVGPEQHLLGAPPVLLERLALPGVDRDTRGRLRRAARGRPTIAAAAWSCVEKMLQLAQRTSAPSATRVSISTAVWMVMCSEPVIARTAQRLRLGVLAPDRHQARHLVLGELDLLAPERRERQVGHLEVALGEGTRARRWAAEAYWSLILLDLRRAVDGYQPYAARAAAPAPTCAGCTRTGAHGVASIAAGRRPVLPPGLVPPRVARTRVAMTLRG